MADLVFTEPITQSDGYINDDAGGRKDIEERTDGAWTVSSVCGGRFEVECGEVNADFAYSSTVPSGKYIERSPTLLKFVLTDEAVEGYQNANSCWKESTNWYH